MKQRWGCVGAMLANRMGTEKLRRSDACSSESGMLYVHVSSIVTSWRIFIKGDATVGRMIEGPAHSAVVSLGARCTYGTVVSKVYHVGGTSVSPSSAKG